MTTTVTSTISKAVNKDLLARFSRIRSRTEELCAPLQIEDYVVQPVVDVSPPKWHIGHTTWFFEEFVLDSHMQGYERFDSQYAFLFNSYYETVGRRVVRTDRGNMTRPSVEEVYQYRAYVNQHMKRFLLDKEPSDELIQIIELGLQHEEQHQELLLYDIKYILGGNPLLPAYTSPVAEAEGSSGKMEFLPIEEGVYEIGHTGKGFCFDNELGRHKVYLQPYAISDRLVTNREYLEFIEDGGYHNFRHWLQEGWEWVKQESPQAPFYWHLIDGTWHTFTLHGLQPLNMDAPVSHINFYEADAYAKWLGLRLPTEQEWEVACRTYAPRPPQDANFQETNRFEPAVRQNNNHQFWGDAWEWTASAYRPYPYFDEPEGALGEYNGKFMINQMVLRGGSCATPKDHIRISYRNFFHPHLRWMFSGIRLAKFL